MFSRAPKRDGHDRRLHGDEEKGDAWEQVRIGMRVESGAENRGRARASNRVRVFHGDAAKFRVRFFRLARIFLEVLDSK